MTKPATVNKPNELPIFVECGITVMLFLLLLILI
jgi:hypothetical protein